MKSKKKHQRTAVDKAVFYKAWALTEQAIATDNPDIILAIMHCYHEVARQQLVAAGFGIQTLTQNSQIHKVFFPDPESRNRLRLYVNPDEVAAWYGVEINTKL